MRAMEDKEDSGVWASFEASVISTFSFIHLQTFKEGARVPSSVMRQGRNKLESLTSRSSMMGETEVVQHSVLYALMGITQRVRVGTHFKM